MNPSNINKQIDELSHLKDGWFDGKGKVLGRENLEWFSESYEVSLEIIFDNKTGYYQFLDLKTNNCIDLKFDLNNDLDCKKLSQELFNSINLKEILL